MYDKALRLISAAAAPVLVFSCAAFISAVLVRYCVVPQRALLSSQAAQTASYRRLVSEKDKYRALTAIMLEKKDSLMQKIERFSMPQRGAADLTSLLQLLISKAKEADIRFVKMEPQTDAARPRDASYPVVLEMTTSYRSLGRFVSSLEQLPQALRIDRLAITEEKNGLMVRLLVTCFIGKTD